MLPNKFRRCAEVGPRCPSRAVCQRHTCKGTDANALVYGALAYTREAGSSACPSFIREGVDVLAISFEDDHGQA